MEVWDLARALITGGAGFIGLHLARALVERGHQVTLWDNLSRGHRDDELQALLGPLQVELAIVDLTDPAQVQHQKGDFALVFHLAAINGTRFFYEVPERVLRVNLLSTINLLDWLASHGCGRLLFSSSSETYAGTVRTVPVAIPTPEDIPLTVDDPKAPRNSYAMSKIVGEGLVHSYAGAYGIPATVVRYHNVYGPRMGTEHVIPEFCLRVLRAEHPFHIYGAEDTRAFCYIDDAVQGTLLAVEKDRTAGETLNIGNSKEEIKIETLARRLFAIAQVSPLVEIHPAPAGSVARRCPDTSRLEALTGYSPRVDLQEGLTRTYRWYAAHNA